MFNAFDFHIEVTEAEQAQNFSDLNDEIVLSDSANFWVVYYCNPNNIRRFVNNIGPLKKFLNSEFRNPDNLWVSHLNIYEAWFFETENKATQWIIDYNAEFGFVPHKAIQIKDLLDESGQLKNDFLTSSR